MLRLLVRLGAVAGVAALHRALVDAGLKSPLSEAEAAHLDATDQDVRAGTDPVALALSSL